MQVRAFNLYVNLSHAWFLNYGAGNAADEDSPARLFVGQLVMALHPQTRLPSYGKILTANIRQCRVQFDRSDLGARGHIRPF